MSSIIVSSVEQSNVTFLAGQSPQNNIRFTFISMLFALTISEVVRQFSLLLIDNAATVNQKLPAFAHLSLAFYVITSSWVGWARSKAPGHDLPVETAFSWNYIVLVIDVVLVGFYYILVRGAEMPVFDKDGDIVKKVVVPVPNVTKELWAMTLIFIGYVVWDIVTKCVMFRANDNSDGCRDGYTYAGLSSRFNKRYRNRGWTTMLALMEIIVLYYVALNMIECNTVAKVLIVDLALMSVVLSFRAFKQWYPQIVNRVAVLLQILYIALLIVLFII